MLSLSMFIFSTYPSEEAPTGEVKELCHILLYCMLFFVSGLYSDISAFIFHWLTLENSINCFVLPLCLFHLLLFSGLHFQENNPFVSFHIACIPEEGCRMNHPKMLTTKAIKRIIEQFWE